MFESCEVDVWEEFAQKAEKLDQLGKEYTSLFNARCAMRTQILQLLSEVLASPCMSQISDALKEELYKLQALLSSE